MSDPRPGLETPALEPRTVGVPADHAIRRVIGDLAKELDRLAAVTWHSGRSSRGERAL